MIAGWALERTGLALHLLAVTEHHVPLMAGKAGATCRPVRGPRPPMHFAEPDRVTRFPSICLRRCPAASVRRRRFRPPRSPSATSPPFFPARSFSVAGTMWLDPADPCPRRVGLCVCPYAANRSSTSRGGMRSRCLYVGFAERLDSFHASAIAPVTCSGSCRRRRHRGVLHAPRLTHGCDSPRNRRHATRRPPLSRGDPAAIRSFRKGGQWPA